jgi:hypothetical protein
MRALKLGAVALLATGIGIVAAGSSSAIMNSSSNAATATPPAIAYAPRVTPIGLANTGRLFAAATGDPTGTRVVAYGGQVPNSNISHADTWVNEADGTWKATCGNVAAHAPTPCGPGPRSGLGLANGSGGVFLFGGFTTSLGQAPTGDTWRWNGTAWTQVCSTATCGPGARGLVAMAGNGDTAVLFGGLGISGITNDTWVFDGTTWTEACGQSGSPCGPPPLGGASMAWDGKNFVLFGGDDLNGAPPVDDTWIFSGDHWTEKCATSIGKPCGPPARALAGFAYAGAPQTGAPGAIVAGGGDIFTSGPTQRLYRDAWFFDGARWTRLDPPWTGAPRTFPQNGSPPAGPDPLLGVMAAKPALCETVYLGTHVRHAGNPPALGVTTWAFGRAPWTAVKPDCKASVTSTTLPSTTTTEVEPGLIAGPSTTVPTLPRTGATAPGASGAFGVALIAFGAVLLAAVRKRKRD